MAGFDAEHQPRSVKTGRTNDELAAGEPPRFEAAPPAPEPELDLSAAREAPMPEFTAPMLATAGDRPFEDPSWLHEVKWDRYRVQAVVRDGSARLWTRNRADGATYFPELAGRAPWIDAREAVLDGEVVALDASGRPSFSALQERTGMVGLEARTGPAESEHGRGRGADGTAQRGPHRVPGLRPPATSTAFPCSTSRSSRASACCGASCGPTRSSTSPPTSPGRGRRFSLPPWGRASRAWSPSAG